MPEEIIPQQQGPSKEDFDRLMSNVQQLAHGQQELSQRTSWLPNPQAQPAPQPTNIFADPDKAIGERMQAAIAPLANLAIGNTIQMARSAASADPRVAIVFAHWPSEIDAEMGQWAPVAQLKAENWVRAAVFVKDAHAEDIKNLKAKERDTFTEGRGGGGGQPSAEDNWQPDDAFMHVAKNMGKPVDLEGFKARRAKRLEFERRSA